MNVDGESRDLGQDFALAIDTGLELDGGFIFLT